VASTITATTGSNHRPIVDLDAGTTLPRVAQVAIIALFIGALAVLTITAAPGKQPGSTVPTAVRPEALTVPALRPQWSAGGQQGPEFPIGPAPAIADLAPLHLAAGALGVPPTGTIDDRN
jgi:hypothetical protein